MKNLTTPVIDTLQALNKISRKAQGDSFKMMIATQQKAFGLTHQYLQGIGAWAEFSLKNCDELLNLAEANTKVLQDAAHEGMERLATTVEEAIVHPEESDEK